MESQNDLTMTAQALENLAIPASIGDKWTLSYEYELTGSDFAGSFAVQFNNVPWTELSPRLQITGAGKFKVKTYCRGVRTMVRSYSDSLWTYDENG